MAEEKTEDSLEQQRVCPFAAMTHLLTCAGFACMAWSSRGCALLDAFRMFADYCEEQTHKIAKGD